MDDRPTPNPKKNKKRKIRRKICERELTPHHQLLKDFQESRMV